MQLTPRFAVTGQNAMNPHGFSMGYAGRILGVCLCRGGARGRIRDREKLLRRSYTRLFQDFAKAIGDFGALNNSPLPPVWY
jgi:hypothetical protein